MRRSAVLYVRVSSLRQVENFSLGVQEKLCRDYCQAQGWQVAQVFREEGESAKTVDRAELTRMLDYSRENKRTVGFIVVHSLSRFSRSTRDHHALTGLLLGWGIQLRSATEPIDVAPVGRLMESVVSAMAQFENELRAGRTREGMRAALAAGRWVFRAPVGFVSGHGRGQPSLAPNGATADLVRAAFDHASRGVPEHEVQRLLESEGYRMPNGRPMSLQTLLR